jgi:hypothetical protein
MTETKSHARYKLTNGGDGYSPSTKTLFVNRQQAISTISRMSDMIIEDWTKNGSECWKCGNFRPFSLTEEIPCPRCGEIDLIPF